MMFRKTAWAGVGKFYPSDKKILETELQQMVRPAENRQKVLGLLAPHAGYMYSGACAGQGYGRVELTETVIILGVNHRGVGPGLALDGNDYWETPLGNVEVNSELRSRLLGVSGLFQLDSEAGRLEHSLEVQVPFIHYASPGSRILPIVVSACRLEDLLAAGKEIAVFLKENRNLMIVASSDMSHYITAARARELDFKAIEKVLQLDAEGLYHTVSDNRISMCGVAPAVIMLSAARTAGASRAELVCYTHSGAVTGEMDEVVGYASLIVF
ncbi:MAG TPA: AmmeMemoRadiSam system protein B [Patescibacteria group bacterium]|nr:AmmeMemoRadiSam system protein B [Patescibacteria group bacterium]